MPYDLQKIDVEALSARNRMKFFQAVSERAGVATQRMGMSLTLYPLDIDFIPLI